MSEIEEWENAVRVRLYQLRLLQAPEHRTMEGWLALLRETTGFEASRTVVHGYESRKSPSEGSRISLRYIYAAARATGTDLLWLLGWEETRGNIPDTRGLPPIDHQGRVTRRKDFRPNT